MECEFLKGDWIRYDVFFKQLLWGSNVTAEIEQNYRLYSVVS